MPSRRRPFASSWRYHPKTQLDRQHMTYPTPHGDKLRALLRNSKLPERDIPGVRATITRYEEWLAELAAFEHRGQALISPMVASLTRYKTAVDLDLVFNSKEDFLYRQKGQLKLDNTIVEEFMPWLVGRVFADTLAGRGLRLGPVNSFSHLRFDSALLDRGAGGGMAIRSKDQDFAMSRPLFIRASHDRDFENVQEAVTHLAYVAAEIKTNLDKTMFQEASATAYDLKLALPNSRYFLLCEWLDMTPISTAVTTIEEVIILRKTKRLSSGVRKNFATAAGRSVARGGFERFLGQYPFAPESFKRLLDHIEALLGGGVENEDIALGRGWF